MRIWLDTDIGSDVDDALALAYILGHPDLELVGISTVFGDLALRGQIAEALLAKAGAEPVPILAGLGVPLADRRQGIMFGHEGLGLLDDPNPTLRVRTESGGEHRIDELGRAMASAEPDVVVAIGPMTNIGALALADVTLPPLAIMGGKLKDVMLPGMVAEISEWNWHCDPLAVQAGLDAASTPPLIVPAEVTFRTRLNNDDVDRLAEGNELNRALAVLCREWMKLQAEQFGRDTPTVALHDPLTVALLVEPDLCGYETRRITVDDRAVTTEAPADTAGYEVRAAATVDAEAVRAHIMDVLLGANS